MNNTTPCSQHGVVTEGTVFPLSSTVSDKGDREDTCPELKLTKRQKEGVGGDTDAVPDGGNRQQGNKLAETITYIDRPGGWLLLAGCRVGPEHSPTFQGWMGLSLRTKLILEV